jgi:hypothetical protein
MANVVPKTEPLCVNVKVGKHSYITLTSPDNDFTSSTKVLAVQDTVHGLDWTAKVSKWKASEIRIRLKANATKAKGKNGKVITTTPPDAGDLTVTITSPVKPVDPVTVDYVNDDETP